MNYKEFPVFVLTLLFLCKLTAQSNHYGQNIADDKIISKQELILLYDKTPEFNAKFKATVVDVCQVKGCWMSLDLGNDKQVMVNFKDYGFFVPKDISGKNVVVSGKAFRRIISVDELKHYAFDRGESKQAIADIIEPEIVYSLTANGVEVLDE